MKYTLCFWHVLEGVAEHSLMCKIVGVPYSCCKSHTTSSIAFLNLLAAILVKVNEIYFFMRV